MANKNTVSILFEADGTAVIKTSDGIEKKIVNNNDAIDKDTKSTTNKISGYWKAMGIGAVAAIAASAGAALLAIKKLSASVIEAASVSEQYEIRLQHLLGSQAEGSRLFEEMAEFAGKVPFEFEKIMGAATQLSGVMKGGVDEVSRWMPLIGDLAAVSGLSIQQTTEQVVRMYSAGAGAADLFRERGILSMLGFKAGVSVSAEETRKKLLEEWNKQGSSFKGATEDLAGSWTGMISMLSDAWFAFRTKIAESGLFAFAKGGIQLVIDAIEDLKKRGQLDKWAKKISDSIIDIGAIIFKSLIWSLNMALEVMRFFHNGWLGIKLVGIGAIHGINVTIEELIKGLRTLLIPLDMIFEGLKKIGQIETNPFDNVEAAFSDFSAASRNILAGVVDDIEKTNATYDGFKNGIIAAGEAMKQLRIESKQIVTPQNTEQFGPALPPGFVEGLAEVAEDPVVAAIKLRMEFRDAEIEQMTSFTDIMAFHAERGVAINNAMAIETIANNTMMAASMQARAGITGVANQAMEDQMLSLIETGKFSVSAMGQIIAQQVKIELAGLAAKAAIKAIYFTGMGIVASTPWGAGAFGPPAPWFAGAAKMALISGAAVAAGSAISSGTGGGAQRPEAGTPGGIPVRVDTGDDRRGDENPPLVINIHQNAAIIGTAEAAAFYEETLLPIMEDAGDRDVILRKAVGNA